MPVVLQDVSLTVRKGEYVVFTGPSGCGKSTLLKLLMCLYPLDSGQRFLAAKNGTQPLTSAWKSLFAYVPQGNQLLSGSIRSIVAFGDEKRAQDENAIYNALKIACADDFVRRLESGLDTVLGERGAGLSEADAAHRHCPGDIFQPSNSFVGRGDQRIGRSNSPSTAE